MAEDKYRIDPTITSKIMDSKSVNYGHAISKMFDDLGGIEVQKEENVQKQEDRALDQQIKGISVQNLQDEVEDAKNYLSVTGAEKPDEAYTQVKFRTPKYQALTKDFVDKNKTFLQEEERKKHYDIASGMFTQEDGTFDRKGAIVHLQTKVKNKELTPEMYGSVVDSIDKVGKNGVYREYTDPSKNYTPEYKNYILGNTDPEFKKQQDNAALQKASGKSEMIALTNALDNPNLTPTAKANIQSRINKLNNISDNQSKSEFLTLVKMSKDPSISEDEREKINERIDKLTNPDITAIAKDLSTEEKYTKQFVAGLQKQDDFKDMGVDSLMDIDMTKLTPSQKAQAERLANIKLRAQKPAAAAEITKRMLDVGVQQQQLNDTVAVTLQYMKDGKDFNMVDKAVRDNFSNYTGLNDKELENSWRDARFQEALNTQLKIQSGTAVSAQEWERFKSAMGTLYQTNKRAATGMLSMATNMKAQVGVLANSMGGEAFHLKYGHIVGNINKMESELQGALFGENKNQNTPKKVTRIIGEQPQTPAQPQPQQVQKQVVKTGTHNGKKVVQYSDGSVVYAD